ncbi:MAG: hypothetical protein WCO11_03135 [Sphingomonadales bacterium]
MLRREPLAHLPALLALILAASAGPARAQTMLSLCAGGSRPGPVQPRRECDAVCHVSCARGRRSGRL